jgi:hypothetical protein
VGLSDPPRELGRADGGGEEGPVATYSSGDRALNFSGFGSNQQLALAEESNLSRPLHEQTCP